MAVGDYCVGDHCVLGHGIGSMVLGHGIGSMVLATIVLGTMMF